MSKVLGGGGRPISRIGHGAGLGDPATTPEALQRSCEASGVPLRLEDEAAAAQIARILRTEHEAREKLAGYNERALVAYDEMRREKSSEEEF